jgi:hypothetical protein
VANLAIAVTAREVNADIFTVVRQNLRANHALFAAYDADITMVSSEIIANECLAVLHTPLLGRFLDAVKREDDAWADRAIERLQQSIGVEAPDIWKVTLSEHEAPALCEALGRPDYPVLLGDLCRDTTDRERRLECVPLLLARGASESILPDETSSLQRGDEVLFAGQPAARKAQRPMLLNVNVRDYAVRGIDVPGGWLWQRLTR